MRRAEVYACARVAVGADGTLSPRRLVNGGSDMKRSVIVILSVIALVFSSVALARQDEVVRHSPHKIPVAKTLQKYASKHRILPTWQTGK